jgi:hypothetical protein
VVSITPRPRFTPGGKSPRYPLYRRLGGPQSRSGRRGKRKNPLPLSGIEPRPLIRQYISLYGLLKTSLYEPLINSVVPLFTSLFAVFTTLFLLLHDTSVSFCFRSLHVASASRSSEVVCPSCALQSFRVPTQRIRPFSPDSASRSVSRPELKH